MKTFSRPSAPRKRLCAKSRSLECTGLTVFATSFARWLNLRTEVAQIDVSMLGKMFSTLRLPANFSRVTSDKSLATRLRKPARSGLSWEIFR